MNDAMTGNVADLNVVAPAAIAQAPAASGNFVEGFIVGFFESVTLRTGEKECIAKNIHGMTESAVGLITEIAKVIGQLVAKQESEINGVGLLGGAGQIVEIVTAAQTLVKGCVQGDVVAVMNATIRHLESPQYVQGRLLANGIDIARVISKAIPAWEKSDFRAVGGDFGTLLRKILLSRHSGPVKMVLPAGMDKTKVYETVVNGVIAGLFVENTSVLITDAVNPSVHVFVDLHACIAKEAPYFSTALNALYLGIAQISTNIEQWQLQQKGIQTGAAAGSQGVPPQFEAAAMGVGGVAGAPELNWMTQLSGLMTNIPKLMDRCGLTEDQRNMMSTAINNMNDVGMAFSIPGPQDRLEAGKMAAIKFDEATAAWKVGNYVKFGELLGGLMRDLLLVIYPQKYHVDNGQMKKYINGPMGGIAQNASSSLPVLVGGFSAVMLLGLSMVRVARAKTRSEPFLQTEDDIEGHHPGDTAVE
jgi:hypothetical protein